MMWKGGQDRDREIEYGDFEEFSETLNKEKF